MSYILDALRKSERQRQIGEVPRVHTQQDGYAAEPTGRNPWIGVAVIAILFNIGIGGWFWWQHQQSTAAPPATALASSVSTPAPTPQPAQTVSPPSASTAAPNPRPIAPAAAAISPLPRQPAAASYPSTPAPELDDVVVFESIARPTAPPASASDRYPDLIDISELPGPLQLAMLALNLNVHVYDDKPSRRFVLIDMKRYAEGHALPQGPVIETITPDGVVLAYQGQRFLLPRN